MAILLEGCDGAPVMWGKIGPYLVQRTKKGAMYIRRYVKPSNPRTIAQEVNRNAFREGILRWTNHERLAQKEYWDETGKNHGFRDGYRAFMSSFMICYQRKVLELGNETAALEWVQNRDQLIVHEVSPGKLQREKSNRGFIAGVLRYRNTARFVSQVQGSLSYLKAKGWLNKIRFGLFPLVDESREWEIIALDLLL